MRYSEYFVQVALLAEKGDVVEAERLLRNGLRYQYSHDMERNILKAGCLQHLQSHQSEVL